MTKIIISSLLVLTLIGCGVLKTNNHPFKVVNAVYENSSSNGYDVNVKISNKTLLDSIYFKGNKAKLHFIKDGYFKAFVPKTSLLKKDMILHSDSKEEFGNTAPITEFKMPFKLKDNEAVVSYKIDDKVRYYKIKKMLGYKKELNE